MYINLNGTGLVLQILALASMVALGRRVFSFKRRPRAVRVRSEVRRSRFHRN